LASRPHLDLLQLPQLFFELLLLLVDPLLLLPLCLFLLLERTPLLLLLALSLPLLERCWQNGLQALKLLIEHE
jgi:hypothetical protein